MGIVSIEGLLIPPDSNFMTVLEKIVANLESQFGEFNFKCPRMEGLREGHLPFSFPKNWCSLEKRRAKPRERWLIQYSGAEGDRTLDLQSAILALSQLSYSPFNFLLKQFIQLNNQFFNNILKKFFIANAYGQNLSAPE